MSSIKPSLLASVPVTAVVSAALAGAGSTYVLYELLYDPSSSTADLFVNGTEVLSDYPGFALSQPARLFFGSGTSNGTGRGHYALVELIVPDPTPTMSGPAYMMFAAALLWLLGRRRVVR